MADLTTSLRCVIDYEHRTLIYAQWLAYGRRYPYLFTPLVQQSQQDAPMAGIRRLQEVPFIRGHPTGRLRADYTITGAVAKDGSTRVGYS